jgi:superfamily II DNA/RNA helicase
MSIKKKNKKAKNINLDISSWNTTDTDEIERRRSCGQLEKFRVENINPEFSYFSSFLVSAKHDRQYCVEIRSLIDHQINSCDCTDYKNNQLGTCKHVEHVLFRLKKSGIKLFKQAGQHGSPRIEIYLDHRDYTIRIAWPKNVRPAIYQQISPFFSTDQTLLRNPILSYPELCKMIFSDKKILKKFIRISRHIDHMIEYQQRNAEKKIAKEVFLKDVKQGKKTLDVVKHPLYPYQKEGMLHLAFSERGMLADEMGLGKTVQAVAACELLRRNQNITRVLVVATASLKAEWEEQIAKFSDASSLIIQGSRQHRLKQYQNQAFFYLTNYEQIIQDGPDIQRLLSPDVIILDEAQRIKNWETKSANAVKQLSSRYAFVLTGTPLENRIDDVYSIVQFLDPYIFGPLFRFNREFYALDDKNKPNAYKNLDTLHQKLRPLMLRRLKSEVEGELPKRTVNNYFISMDGEQRSRYTEYEDKVARLVRQASQRPLYKDEFERLQRWLACMRMLCDTPYILDSECRISPKLRELKKIISDLLMDESAKIIIFSEWERMLQLVREWVQKKRWDAAWHTGSVPQNKRREEINRFKINPHCRLFLSTDSGSLGLNLQHANIVINIDLPWNPAKLEQRIARAWRKHQTRSVQIINLICEDSIEHRMLALLAQKQALAEGVLEGKGDVKTMQLPSGRAAFMERMTSLMSAEALEKTSVPLKENLSALSMDGVVDLLQSYYNETTRQQTLLAVVENQSDEIQKKLRVSLNNTASTLETVDRQTFEIIQRLAAAGILTLTYPTEVLHSSPLFAESQKKVQEQQIQQAKIHLDSALHKQRMAKVLVASEFYEEAVSPLREALKSTIYSFACLIGKTESEMKENMSNHFIQEKLINQHGLPGNTISLFAELYHETEPVHHSKVKHLIFEYQTIFHHVNNKLNAMLGL